MRIVFCGMEGLPPWYPEGAMSESQREMFQAALALSPGQRLELAAELIDSVEGAVDPEWEDAWKLELDERMRAADGREERGSSWPESRRRIVERLP